MTTRPKKRERERSLLFFTFLFFAPWEWRQDKAEKSCLLHDSTRRSFGRQARLPAESSCVSIGTFVLAAASVLVLLYACLCTNCAASRTPHQDCARQRASTSPAYVSMRQHTCLESRLCPSTRFHITCIRQHTSAYVSVRHHSSACVSIRV
jgi:hypothetical protein